MKKLVIILLILANSLLAQSLDTVAVVRIDNIVPISPSEIDFDILLKRESIDWEKITNASFQINFAKDEFTPQIPDINSENFEIVYIDGTSDFDVDYVERASDLLSRDPDKYLIHDEVLDEKFSVFFMGPDDVGANQLIPNNIDFPNDTSVRVGTFKITSKRAGVRVPTILDWIGPKYDYQAIAFKLSDFREQFGEDQYYITDDNLEMENPNDNINFVSYQNDTTFPGFRFQYVDPKYIGNGLVRINWATFNEIFVSGWVVERLEFGRYSTVDERSEQSWWSGVNQEFTVNTFDEPLNPDITYVGIGDQEVSNAVSPQNYEPKLDQLENENKFEGFQYTFVDSTLQNTSDFADKRGKYVCYEISYIDWNDNVVPLGYACEQIPNAIITFTQAKPNPFDIQTTVEYTLDDDCILFASVYDETGKEILTIIDGEERKRGDYSLDVEMPHLAAQGLYNLIFYALPINDNIVEKSSALVKLQLSR